MPVAHTIRRWLWRANAVLALGVLVVWTVVLLDDPASRPPPELPLVQHATEAAPLGPDISFDEMVALARPFHGWGLGEVQERPVEEAAPGGVLPLRAYELSMWIQDPGGPDSIVLNAKDPSRSEAFLPKEGEPDQGVAIERIERRGRRAFITVSRGDERFTYPVLDPSVPTPADQRIVRVVPTPASPSSMDARLADASRGRTDVKVLPFYGRNGQVEGVRVTGVRQGSVLARAGLRAGDVIVGVDDAPFTSVDACRAVLVEDAGARSLRILSPPKKSVRRLDVGS